MSVETSSMFERVIQDHLALKERNARLDGKMPIEGYKETDPLENHPLFKSEEQALLEETMDGVDPDFSDETLEDVGLGIWPGSDAAPAEASSGTLAAARGRGRDGRGCPGVRGQRLLEHRRRPRLRLGRLIAARDAALSLADAKELRPGRAWSSRPSC